MVDWVNPPGSIYCLYYLSGHLRLFTLRPREIPINSVRAIRKTARKIQEFGNQIRKPKKRTYKKIPTTKLKITTHAGFWVNKNENYLEILPTSSQPSELFPIFLSVFLFSRVILKSLSPYQLGAKRNLLWDLSGGNETE